MKIATFTLSTIVTLSALPMAASAVSVGGIITTDTTWSNTSEPYTFSSTVQIKNGVTLTIEPGVQLQSGLRPGSIEVFGNLVVNGTASQPVRIDGVFISPANDGNPENTFSIDIKHASINGGALYTPSSGASYGTLSLQDSVLKGIPYLYLWYPTSDAVIKRNVFLNSGGLSIGTDKNVNVLVENNLFDNPAPYAVKNWASYGTSKTTVRYNSFVNTTNQVIICSSSNLIGQLLVFLEVSVRLNLAYKFFFSRWFCHPAMSP
jgi:hypothetical protein